MEADFMINGGVVGTDDQSEIMMLGFCVSIIDIPNL